MWLKEQMEGTAAETIQKTLKQMHGAKRITHAGTWSAFYKISFVVSYVVQFKEILFHFSCCLFLFTPPSSPLIRGGGVGGWGSGEETGGGGGGRGRRRGGGGGGNTSRLPGPHCSTKLVVVLSLARPTATTRPIESTGYADDSMHAAQCVSVSSAEERAKEEAWVIPAGDGGRMYRPREGSENTIHSMPAGIITGAAGYLHDTLRYWLISKHGESCNVCVTEEDIQLLHHARVAASISTSFHSNLFIYLFIHGWREGGRGGGRGRAEASTMLVAVYG